MRSFGAHRKAPARYDAAMATSAAIRVAGHPLAGAGVVVTRSGTAANALRRRIAALGGTPVLLPGLGIAAVADPDGARRALRAAVARADALVFTSPIAVAHAFRLLPTLRPRRACAVLAPGAGSARALQRRGIAAQHPRERQDSEGVLAMPQLAHVRGRRVVLVGADGGRELLAQELRRRRARVETVSVYRRGPPRLDRRHHAALAAAPSPLIALFSSAQALGHLRALLPPPLCARLLAGECVVSSPRLAEAARALQFVRVHVAASAAPDALVAAARAALARHRL